MLRLQAVRNVSGVLRECLFSNSSISLLTPNRTVFSMIPTNVEVCDESTTVQQFARTKLDAVNTDDFDEAFFVCNLRDVLKKWQLLQEALPKVEPFYAVKSNHDPTLLKYLGNLEANFDCASKGELQQVTQLGVEPDRIIYANPCKQISHLLYAKSKNVKMMTFDCADELKKIKLHYPETELVLRLKVDSSQSDIDLGAKFGVEPSDVPSLLQLAKDLDLNIIGVSFHVGSLCKDAHVYYEAIKLSKTAFEQAHAVGFHFTLLDIGGGFPGEANLEHQGPLFHQFNSIRKGLDNYFPQSLGVRIISEPGRYFVTSAYTLVCNITTAKRIRNGSDQSDEMNYFINDGIYSSLSNVRDEKVIHSPYPLIDDDEKIIPSLMNSEGGKEILMSRIWGQSCDSLDLVVSDIHLPIMCSSGQSWLCFDNMGGYTLSTSTYFNGFTPPKVYYMFPSSK